MKYGQSEIKECLVNQRPPDSVDVLQGAEPDLLQYVGPVLLLQGEGDHGLLHLRLDLLSLGDLLQELSPEYLHHARTEILTDVKPWPWLSVRRYLERAGKRNLRRITICSRVAFRCILRRAM